MARKIIWTQTAEEQLDKVIEYIEANWTDRELTLFFKKLEKGLETISKKPSQHKKSHRKELAYEYQLSPQTTIFYTFDDNRTTILLLWSNRMNPNKL